MTETYEDALDYMYTFKKVGMKWKTLFKYQLSFYLFAYYAIYSCWEVFFPHFWRQILEVN